MKQGLAPALAPAGVFDGWRTPPQHSFVPPAPAPARARYRIHPGSGQPVLVFPRQGAGAESTAALRSILSGAGFRAQDWGQGRDQGPGTMGLDRWLRKLEETVIDMFEATQARITLLGWGLSGIYARELARRATPLVRQVITLGTPFNTPADPQRTCPVLAMLDAAGRLPLAARTRLRLAPPVPLTAICSRYDGTVRWEQCVDRLSGQAECIEIAGARHHELATHPLALEAISQRLAQAEDSWSPFVREEAPQA